MKINIPKILNSKWQLTGLTAESKFTKSKLHVNNMYYYSTLNFDYICCGRYGNKFHRHKYKLKSKDTRSMA